MLNQIIKYINNGCDYNEFLILIYKHSVFFSQNRFFVVTKMKTDLNVELMNLFIQHVADKHVPILIRKWQIWHVPILILKWQI